MHEALDRGAEDESFSDLPPRHVELSFFAKSCIMYDTLKEPSTVAVNVYSEAISDLGLPRKLLR